MRRTVLPPFEVNIHDAGRVRVIEVHGEIDILTAPKLDAALHDDGDFDRLVLDLTHVGFMSSVGIGLLASINRRVRQRGGTVVLAGLQPQVTRLLEGVGLLDAFAG